MNVNDFRIPTSHPFGMLKGYENASEKEATLAIILRMCIEQGNFGEVKTKYSHPSMVEDGLLYQTGPNEYKLTIKALGLLYSHYGKG